MAEKPLGLFVNRFEASTRGNFTAASEFGLNHCNSLFADSTTSPIALTCYNNVKPKYDFFEATRVAHASQSGIQGGTVLSFTQILDSMPAEVKKWQTAIELVYAEGSIRWVEMFPKGKATLNKGKQQNRVNAVNTLLTTIGTDASLATIKTVIQTFYTAMLLAYSTKGISKESTVTDSTAVETARIAMCDEIEGNYGLLINTYKANPSLAAKYFDEAYLTNKLQLIFDLKVKMLSTKNAIKRTFATPATQQFQITNKTNTTLKIFLSLTRYGLAGLIFVTIPPDSVGVYDLTAMGDNTTQKFLNVQNMDDKIKADVTIKVL